MGGLPVPWEDRILRLKLKCAYAMLQCIEHSKFIISWRLLNDRMNVIIPILQTSKLKESEVK